MTGGGSDRPKIPIESPAPTIREREEVEGAKKKIRVRRRGREATILASRMMEEVRGVKGYRQILG